MFGLGLALQSDKSFMTSQARWILGFRGLPMYSVWDPCVQGHLLQRSSDVSFQLFVDKCGTNVSSTNGITWAK